MSIQRLTFEGILNYLSTKKGTVWNMVFQASQLELEDFNDSITYGNITLNLSPNATCDMKCYDDHVYFKMRKHGIVHEIMAPYTALMIIQDPDDPSESMAWPYFLDHGDDYIPDEPDRKSNVFHLPNSGIKVELRVPTLADYNNLKLDNVIHFPGGSAHVGEEIQMDKPLTLGELIKANQQAAFAKQFPDLVGNDGNIDPGKVYEKSQSMREPTLLERIELRGWKVIEGGGHKPEASMPFIDEVYRAKRAKRESDAALAKITVNAEVKLGGFEIRSDGSNGNSVYFPDLDVSKCHFPVRRINRPTWVSVIEGGKRD